MTTKKEMNRNLPPVLLILLVFCTIPSTLTSTSIKGITVVSVPFTRITYRNKMVKHSLQHVKETGATYISIPVTLYQDTLDSVNMTQIYK